MVEFQGYHGVGPADGTVVNGKTQVFGRKTGQRVGNEVCMYEDDGGTSKRKSSPINRLATCQHLSALCEGQERQTSALMLGVVGPYCILCKVLGVVKRSRVILKILQARKCLKSQKFYTNASYHLLFQLRTWYSSLTCPLTGSSLAPSFIALTMEQKPMHALGRKCVLRQDPRLLVVMGLHAGSCAC